LDYQGEKVPKPNTLAYFGQPSVTKKTSFVTFDSSWSSVAPD